MTYPTTWHGTRIVKSTGNEFSWRGKPSRIFDAYPNEFKRGLKSPAGVRLLATTEPRPSPAQAATRALLKDRHGGQYSKAVAAK